MADTTEQLSKPVIGGKFSYQVAIHTVVKQEGGLMRVTAHAEWWDDSIKESRSAQSVRELDIIALATQSGVSSEEFIEATKRDALRELVTMLNLHGVL